MSSDTLPTTVPSFECKLPPDLLEGLSARDKYLYTSQDEMRQAIAWLASMSAKQADKVEAVHVQATFTNGKVAQATADIIALKDAVTAHQKQTEPIVKAYNFASWAARKKATWVIVALFVLIGVPFIVTHATDPQKLVSWAVKTMMGG